MQKIKLDPENLRVDTFAVAPEPGGRDGTVRAHSPEYTFTCWCCSTAEPICPTAVECHTDGGPCFTENHTVCDCDQAPDETDGC